MKWRDLVTCETCMAVVPRVLIEFHAQWHKAIASVAIESTDRINTIEQSLDFITRPDPGE